MVQQVVAVEGIEGTRVRRAGMWCLGAGLVGAAQAAVVIAWSPAVSDDRYSYPFASTGHIVAQATFFLQHLPLLAGLVALLWLAPVRSSRSARIGVWIGAAGMALLAVMELVTMSAADVATDSSRADLVNALYGPPTILIGVGLTVAGLALWRSPEDRWPGAPWVRWLVPALGIYVFVPLTPAIMGPFVAGRLGIGVWMLLFAGLGLGLVRLARTEPA
jgi:hypothetical protein